MKSKKSKFTVSRLFRNNQFILILSVIISICLWINISLSDTNDSTTTVTNIPIQINLSDEAVNNGLQIFSGNDQTASVSVTGNRVSLGSLSQDDIVVSAQTAGTITTPGTYPLSLSAKKANPSDNFEITSSVSPSVITIFVDYAKETAFEVENRIKYNVSEGYHADVALSASSITITGPQTEVSKISTVAIEGEVQGSLRDNTEIVCDVKLYDYTGAEYTNNTLVLSETVITANFKVEPEKVIPLRVAFENKPDGLDLTNKIKISTESILVAGPQDILEKTTYIYTEKIDFNTLKNKKSKFELDIDMPENCSNLNDNKTVEVTIDLSSYGNRRIRSDTFSVKGLDDGYSYDITTDSLNIKVLGPDDQLSQLKPTMVSCVIDASSIEGTTGSISLPVEVSISEQTSCWSYGTYKVNISVTKN